VNVVVMFVRKRMPGATAPSSRAAGHDPEAVVKKVVLPIQDTTSLNYHGLEATDGLVPIGGGKRGVRGLWAHVGLAVNLAGLPFGVFSLDATSCDGASSRKRATSGTCGTLWPRCRALRARPWRSPPAVASGRGPDAKQSWTCVPTG